RLVQAAALERLDVEIFYGDDVVVGEPPRLKPTFDLAQLIAQDYIGAPLIVRGSALRRLGWPESGPYALVLRAEAAGVAIARTPEVLAAYPHSRPATPLEDRRRALQTWIGARPFEIAQGRTPETLQLRRRFERFPEVTLAVPTRQ